MKQKHLDMYMDIAEVAAKNSYATRLKVGAVAVRDHRILSIGYNGTPPGTSNECEEKVYKIDGFLVDDVGCYELKTKKEVIHAEMNLIYKMARDGESGKGATLFITHAPCFECAKAILSVGFSSVYYRNSYRDNSGVDLLRNNGVKI